MHVLDTWKPLDALSFTKGDSMKTIETSIIYTVEFFYTGDLTGIFFNAAIKDMDTEFS